MIKAIIFDFDGVLVESVDIKTEAFEEIFKNEKKSIRKRIVDYHIKNGGVSRFDKLKFIYDHILEKELPNETYERLCGAFSELVIDKVVNAGYVDGAKDFLDNYSGQYECFVVSGTPEEEIREIIRRRNMEHYFKKIYGAPRPKHEAVKEILNKYNFLPGEAAYVGDAIIDHEAAEANLTNFIARIKDNESLFAAIKCKKIQDLKDLKESVDSLTVNMKNLFEKSGES